MKRQLLTVLLLAAMAPLGWSIPQSFFGGGQFFGPVIPAMPRFNADLTEPFLLPDNWAAQTLPGPWAEEIALPGQTLQHMSALPVLFGAVPDQVSAYRDTAGLRQISITYLDAGKFFGFKEGGEKTAEDRQAGAAKRAEFAQHFNQLSRELRRRLEEGCGPGRMTVVGRSDLLRSTCTDFRWEDFILRLAVLDGHAIGLNIMRAGREVTGYLDDSLASLRPKERAALLKANVAASSYGDVQVRSIPMFDQGSTPFCGIHSLAMVGHYYGLRLNADTLAAGAHFKNTGSARGSDVFDLYHAMAEEIGMRVSVTSNFDIKRVQTAIREGMPVIVWRRVTKEREAAHTEFAVRYAADSSLRQPAVTDALRASWPEKEKKGTPSHATVISGFNPERGEVLFTEPWGEDARDRRMRVEEMTATAYAVFHFRF